MDSDLSSLLKNNFTYVEVRGELAQSVSVYSASVAPVHFSRKNAHTPVEAKSSGTHTILV